MKERLKELRKHFQLTQEGFAQRLSITRGAVANYEVGRNEPTDAVLELMAREFGVSIKWLKTGEGSMFNERTQEYEAFFDSLLKEDGSSFKRRLVSVLARLSPKQWEVLESIANELSGVGTKEQLTPEEEARREAEEFYRQRLLEKRRAAELEASGRAGPA